MTPELIRPNLHVIWIHYPLALLTLGAAIEVLTSFASGSSLRNAGRWMIGFGAFLGVVAVFSGIYALSDVARRQNPAAEGAWVDVRAASPLLSPPAAWQDMRQHLIFQSASTGLCAAVAVVWIGLSDHTRRTVRVPLLLLLLAGVGLSMTGAWFGGELVYRHAAGVDASASPTPAKRPPASASLLAALPTLAEVHVISAGTVVAVALAAIGLSCRKITATYRLAEEVEPMTAMEVPMRSNPGAKVPRTPPSAMALVRSFNPGVELTIQPFAPATRFWLVTVLLAIGTAGAGLLLLIQESDALTTAAHHHQPLALVLWNQIKPTGDQPVSRLLAHLATGTLLILTPLVLALLARFGPRQRFWLGVFTLVLLAAVTLQVWLGVLLLLDTSDGPVERFNPTAAGTP